MTEEKCGPCEPRDVCKGPINPKCACKETQPLLQKVYEIRIDNETDGYAENMNSYTILARSFDEAVLIMKERLYMQGEGCAGDVIGEVKLVAIISN